MKSTKYTRIEAEEISVQNKARSRRRDWVVVTLLSIIIILACLSALMIVQLSRLQSFSYRRGFLTELGIWFGYFI